MSVLDSIDIKERIEVSYDAPSRQLRIGEEPTTQSVIVLERAEFTVRDGERRGCGASGKLGFIIGEQMEQGSIEMGDIQKMQRIQWDWTHFVHNGKRVYSADRVMIIGSGMVALNPITD